MTTVTPMDVRLRPHACIQLPGFGLLSLRALRETRSDPRGGGSQPWLCPQRRSGRAQPSAQRAAAGSTAHPSPIHMVNTGSYKYRLGNNYRHCTLNTMRRITAKIQQLFSKKPQSRPYCCHNTTIRCNCPGCSGRNCLQGRSVSPSLARAPRCSRLRHQLSVDDTE